MATNPKKRRKTQYPGGKGQSKAASYMRKAPKKTRENKASIDKEINARPEQIKKRVEANKARRKAKREGRAIAGKDASHKNGKVTGFVKRKTNRGKAGEGGRKKGKGTKSKRK